ncbi:NUDIX hydrolase [Deinococcus psychrotolerans]|uniref:NUDIX hydrolase n=1 Tax=Deinococcus psychrotolerans TaxID=2489213 RepID=A0A3G8Y914_9DEIO|nr:NUDIX hydrolase [Deinococcus psychrotolerans]AZI41849.1 NUDIX hydrolase [Deinococcus psychrotolerans]
MISSSPTSQVPVPGAGGVVLRGRRVLLVRYKSGDWAFPKGHLEAGESAQQAAVREVQEETGVQASIAGELPTTHYTNDRGEARAISWFLMEASTEAGELESTFIEGGFVSADEALTTLSFGEDRELLRAALKQAEREG